MSFDFYVLPNTRKESFVLTANNEPRVGTLMAIGNVTLSIAIERKMEDLTEKYCVRWYLFERLDFDVLIVLTGFELL